MVRDPRPGEELSIHRGASPAPEKQRHAQARITRRTSSPVQSGPAHVGEWILEFEPATAPEIEPLMGWISSDDVLQQVILTFDSRKAAEDYCKREHLPYTVQAPHERKRRPKSYADNFVPFEDGGPRPIYPH
jgi:hypothetical protein